MQRRQIMILPEKNVVGKSKVDKEIMKTDDWRMAKREFDANAADRIIDKLWSNKKTDELRELLKNEKEVVFISQPSTSRLNMLPIQLAKRLSSEFNASFLCGDNYFKQSHSEEAKNISRSERPFRYREYEGIRDEILKSKIEEKALVVVEDVITTGGSVAEFSRELMRSGHKVASIIALMGDKRLNIDEKTISRLDKTFKDKSINIEAGVLAEFLTRSETGTIIMNLSSLRTENGINKFAGKIQRLLDERLAQGLGRDKDAGGDKSIKGNDKSNGFDVARIPDRDILDHRGKKLTPFKSILPIFDAQEKQREKDLQEDVIKRQKESSGPQKRTKKIDKAEKGLKQPGKELEK